MTSKNTQVSSYSSGGQKHKMSPSGLKSRYQLSWFSPGGSRGEAVFLPFSRCLKKNKRERERDWKRLIALPKAMLLEYAKAETQPQICPAPDHSLTRADCKDLPCGWYFQKEKKHLGCCLAYPRAERVDAIFSCSDDLVFAKVRITRSLFTHLSFCLL